MKQTDLVQVYSVIRTTLYEINKNRTKIKTYVKTTAAGTDVRIRDQGYPKIEQAFYNWILQKRKIYPIPRSEKFEQTWILSQSWAKMIFLQNLGALINSSIVLVYNRCL